MSRSAIDTAQRIAEATATTWHRCSFSNNITIALGTVAALALVQPLDGENGKDMARKIGKLSDTDLAAFLREIWTRAWLDQPYLVDEALTLHEWLDTDDLDTELMSGVRGVAMAVLNAGLTTLTGYHDPDLRSSVDVLGAVLTQMRSHGARQGMGEYHTPTDVADVMARMVFGSELPDPGTRFNEPAGGTGGLFRSAAQHIRDLGGDPAAYRWVLQERDRLASALAAVNAMLWGLGTDVLVVCADTLTDPEAPERAAARRAAVVEHHDKQVGIATAIAATRRALAFLDSLPDPSIKEAA
ncbi:N-6 DNA methylase [Nocardia sp. IFM 10818]